MSYLGKPIRGRSYWSNCWLLLVSHKCDGTHAPDDPKQPCWPNMANWVHKAAGPDIERSTSDPAAMCDTPIISCIAKRSGDGELYVVSHQLMCARPPYSASSGSPASTQVFLDSQPAFAGISYRNDYEIGEMSVFQNWHSENSQLLQNAVNGRQRETSLRNEYRCTLILLNYIDSS